MRRVTISLLALLAFLPAGAQERLGDLEIEEPELRRYTVEVIIFRYAQDVSTGSEIFPPDEPPVTLPSEEEGMAFADTLPLPVETTPEPLPDTELVLLDAADYQLGDILDRMRRLDVYEPVMHFGWTQATWPEEQTAPVPLHRFARPPPELDGDITLYLSRFLHLVVDLKLEAPKVRTFNTDEQERLGDTQTVGELLGELDAQAPVYYRLREDRILKNGELRYFDHPKFGVLAKVTRIEEEEAGDVNELLGYGTE